LRDLGRDREEAAARARIDALNKEKQFLEQYGDKQGAEALDARVAAAERELRIRQEAAELQRESDHAHVQAANLQQQAIVSSAHGNFAAAAAQANAAHHVEDQAEQRRRVFELTSSGQYTKEEAQKQAAEEQRQRAQERVAQAEAFRTQRQREIYEGGMALKGNTQGLAEARDSDAFRDRIREGIANHLSPQEAAQYAYQSGMQEITAQQRDFNQSHVVDSLQRIGGGGGVASDPGLDSAKRRESLQQQMLEVLRQIAQQGDGGGIPNDANVDDGGF
jgi:hypothetical protein